MTGEPIPAAELDRQITVLARRYHAAPGRIGGLTPAAYGLLIRLGDHGPLRTTDLAHHVEVTPSTVTRQLQVLEGLGLVERQPAEGDGRAHLVALTAAGRDAAGRAESTRVRQLRERLAAWTAADIGVLTDLLRKLNDADRP